MEFSTRPFGHNALDPAVEKAAASGWALYEFPAAFHLEAGRLCVLTTRHRHACIVVGRASIPELLDAHPSTEPVHLNVLVKFPDGREAHQFLLAHLQQWKVKAP